MCSGVFRWIFLDGGDGSYGHFYESFWRNWGVGIGDAFVVIEPAVVGKVEVDFGCWIIEEI